MKFASFISVLFLTLSSNAFADDTITNFHENCARLTAKFGDQAINYGYTNFQNLPITVSTIYKLVAIDCTSDQDRYTVTAANAAYPNINIQLTGELDLATGKMIHRAANLGSCPYGSARLFLDYLRSNMTAVIRSTEIAVNKSYLEQACPALRDQLIVKLNETAVQINADLAAE